VPRHQGTRVAGGASGASSRRRRFMSSGAQRPPPVFARHRRCPAPRYALTFEVAAEKGDCLDCTLYYFVYFLYLPPFIEPQGAHTTSSN